MKRKAFTLIELLVVIAVIALLLSIVIPSLNMAKETARKVICASNLKSIGQSVFVYAKVNDEFLPDSWYDPVGAPNPWRSYLLFYINKNDPSLSGKARVTSSHGLGNLYMTDLIETGETFYCPSAPKYAEGDVAAFRYEYYSRGGTDFPFDNVPGTTNSGTVRSSYNYVPQRAGSKVRISSSYGTGDFPDVAKKASQLHSSYTMVSDLIRTYDVLNHKKGSGKLAGGINVLFSDGSVHFTNNQEAFARELWRDGIDVGNDAYLFRSILSRLR